MKLGFLGPKGTFSFEAAKKYLKDGDFIEYKTISDIILGIINNEIDEGIVPIENSIQGGVTETIDTLIENNEIFVNSELTLIIRQNLMGNKKYNLNEVKELYSHPQAIAQCRNYIEKNLKNAKINYVSSTAMAAKEILKKDFCACIANLDCVEEYGLTLLDPDIQDNNFNKTRFWILSKKENDVGNKMSLIFSTKNKPGDLYKILEIFYINQINLTKIESRPAKTELGSYIFLVDLEINEKINNVLNLLKKECKYLKNLGKY